MIELLLLVPVAYGTFLIHANNRACGKLHHPHYAARACYHGLVLDCWQPASDSAPCEVRWTLKGETVNIELGPYKMLKLLSRPLNIKELEAMSKWPVSRLP